jgi:hypothetical protein
MDSSLTMPQACRSQLRIEGEIVRKAEEIAGRKVSHPDPRLSDPGLALCLSGGGIGPCPSIPGPSGDSMIWMIWAFFPRSAGCPRSLEGRSLPRPLRCVGLTWT